MKNKDVVLRALDEVDNQLFIVIDLVGKAEITGQDAVDRLNRIRVKLQKVGDSVNHN
jgi:hypothetical protein